jgi:hypothetical protein
VSTGIAEGLWDYLSTNVPLAGAWWPLRIPDGATMPAGTYQRISSAPSATTHSGGTALMRRRYQLTVFSDRHGAGLEAARDIVTTLNGVRTTMDGYDVTAILVDDAEDIDPEPRGLYRQRVDIMLTSEAP